MADHSTIEWTDSTWNVITGCEIESPGCRRCYAMRLAGTRLRHHWSREGLTKASAAGPVWTGETRFNEQWLRQPLQWKRKRRIFVVAHGDLFYERVPDAWIDQVFAVMVLAPQHTFQVLTKRTARMATYIKALGTPAGYDRLEAAARAIGYTLRHEGIPLVAWPFKHVWLGTSIESQPYAEVRREPLREIASGGWLTWVSYEPALGAVNWTGWEFLRWFVSGGESGADARPSHPDWHRAARDFCKANSIPFHFKQWGAWKAGNVRVHVLDASADVAWPDGTIGSGSAAERGGGGVSLYCVGKKAAGRLLDGRTHDEYPR